MENGFRQRFEKLLEEHKQKTEALQTLLAGSVNCTWTAGQELTMIESLLNDIENNVSMTRTRFEKYGDALRAIMEDCDKKSKALQVLCPEGSVWYDNSHEISLILDMLGFLIPESLWSEGDYYRSDIEWFWHEYYEYRISDPLEAEVNGKKFKIGTWEDLWDMIHYGN